jgi:hypothetical protein
MRHLITLINERPKVICIDFFQQQMGVVKFTMALSAFMFIFITRTVLPLVPSDQKWINSIKRYET